MIFRISQKLRANIQAGPLESLPLNENRLADWSAQVFVVTRKQYVLLTNTKTLAADKLRNNMDAAEYKHVVLGLIFLKYISDAFEEMHAKLVEGKGKYEGSDPEDADEYRAENVFCVPKEARWSTCRPTPNSPPSPEVATALQGAELRISPDRPRTRLRDRPAEEPGFCPCRSVAEVASRY